MEGKNRRTKRKDSSDSDSGDSSSEDDSPVSKKMKNVSYVEREVVKKINKTRKVLNKICDSEDDSDPKRRLLLKRPISTVPIVTKKPSEKKFNSSDNSSSCSEDLSEHSKRNIKAKKTVTKYKKQSEGESESDTKKEKIVNKNKSKVMSKKNKSVFSHNKIKSNSELNKSAKEFQKPKETKKKSSFVENNEYDDYTILETPTKSDEESIPVDRKFEITLKHHIIQEFDKIQKITDELKETLEYNSEYVVGKQVNVVGDSKFLAHKILRIYDSTYKKLKESKNDFFKKYTEWVNTCSKNKSSKDGSYTKSFCEASFKSRFKISSDDSSDSKDSPISKSVCTEKGHNVSKNKSFSKKSKDTSESDSSQEVKKRKDLEKTKKSDKSLNKEESFEDRTSKKSIGKKKSSESNESMRSPVKKKDCETNESSKTQSNDEIQHESQCSVNVEQLSLESNEINLSGNDQSDKEEGKDVNSESEKNEVDKSLESSKKNEAISSSEDEEVNVRLKISKFSKIVCSLEDEEVDQRPKTPEKSKAISSSEDDVEMNVVEHFQDASEKKTDKNKKKRSSLSSKSLDNMVIPTESSKDQKIEKTFFSDSEQSKSDKENGKSEEENGSGAEALNKSESKKSKSKDVKKIHQSDSEAKVSESDSDEIFSGNESQSKKTNQANSKIVTAKEVLKKINETNANSEEMFDSTASEIPNTPVKSPILSSNKTSLRKTLHISQQTILSDLENELNQQALAKSNGDGLEVIEEAEYLSDDQEEEQVEVVEKIIKGNKAMENQEVEEETKAEVRKKASNTEDTEDETEIEIRNKLLQDSESEVSSNSETGDDESVIEDNDSDIVISIDDASDNAINTTSKKSLPSSAESRSKTKKLTKKSNKLPIQTKTRSNLSSDSSSSEDQQQLRVKRQTKKKRSLSHDDSDKEISLQPLAKRRCGQGSFIVQNNRHFKADKKLRVPCRVVLKRLPKSVLDKYTRALAESKAYVANKKFDSLTNLASLEGKKKSKKRLNSKASENDNKSTKAKNKTKKENKPNKSRVEEESDVESDSDVLNKVNDHESHDNSVEQDIMEEAENEAKEALLDSSGSDSENEKSLEVDGNDEPPKKSKAKTAKENNKENDTVDVSNENSVSDENEGDNDDETESNENGGKKKGGEWKNDSLLNFHVTDTESDEEKFEKSQERKKTKKEKEKNKKSNEDSIEVIEESPIKEKVSRRGRKQRKARRILDSESDGNNGSSEEDQNEENEEVSDDDFELDADEEKEEEVKKKKGKKRRPKSSDSETSSSEKKSKSKRKRIKKIASDDSDTDKDSPGKGRKNIRKVLRDKHVADDTKKAAQDEEERLKRIAERQKLFNEMYDAKLAGEAKVDKLVLDFDEETKKELVVVDAQLVKRLKPHQAQGIKFMWDACFESLKQIEKSEGSGCIIAHCMGLGKTFQVVTLVHTLLSHESTDVRTVMIVCPLSTVLNWVNEFKMWLKHTTNGDDIEIFELTKMKKNIDRKGMLENWQNRGGVLIIGYEMFRNLTSTGRKMRKAMQESVTRSLVDPGADLVVCDEGHLLKNEESALSKAMKLVKTMRRIVLTGTPLQNNLKEYHCMVQFVKPNLLGTKKEFLNRFVNPITNGQFDDSTAYDVKIMKKRAHVLHKMLEGSVQRFDYSVLTPFLPPKQEYVIFVRLTDVQIKLYQHYLENFARRYSGRNGSLFADFQELQRIWTHPFVLRLNAERIDKKIEKKRLEASDSEGSLKDFIDDDSDSEASNVSSSGGSSSGSDVQCIDSDTEKRPVKMTRAARMNLKEELQDEVPIVQATTEETAWWSKFLEEQNFEDMRISTKLMLLFGILKESEQIGDKVLVFSQSLYSLTLIEHFLKLIDQESQNDGEKAEFLENHSGRWIQSLDYFRLDGSHSAENRSGWCKTFNDPKNTRARLFLISTRAGGLGINLTAANRVIIFDASWNPSHDVQSIFRVYRFGQKKPCYIYRFLAAGTMEEKIYNRQVTKLSLACRVVDEQQIERHYSNNDLAELYQFDTYEDKHPTLALPKDRLLAEIFLKYKDNVYNYHEHDSLLENKAEEELDEEERKQAWLEYEEEKQGKRQMINMGMNNAIGGINQLFMNMNNSPEFEGMKMLIQKDYPHLPPEHLESVARQAMFEMYRFVDQQGMNPGLAPFAPGHLQGNLFGAPQLPPMTQQQHTINQQNQLMNLLNQPTQMNYQGINSMNHMPAYSGRGRPPKHLSNPVYNPINPIRQLPMQVPMQAPMHMPMQLQHSQMLAQQNADDLEVLMDKGGIPLSNDITSNSNNKPEE